MFKFIHAADIHLDSPMRRLEQYEGAPVDAFRLATRRAFENLVELACSEGVAFVLIAGDLFDGDWKDYNSGLYLVAQLNRLKEAGIPVYIAAGNHDAAGTITKSLRFPGNVKVMSPQEPETHLLDNLKVAIHGQSFSMPAESADLSRHYPLPLGGYYNIGLLHTCATGREGHEPYAPCSLEGLKGKGYQYWALGHVHAYEILSSDPPVVFSGNTQGRHVREAGAKGCVLVSVEDSFETVLEFIALDVVRWAVVRVDAEDASDAYAVLDRIGLALDGVADRNIARQTAVRVEISGRTPAHNELSADVEHWINEVRATALGAGSDHLWVEKVIFNTRPPLSAVEAVNPGGAVGELIGLFQELSTDSAAREILHKELAEIESKLPHEMWNPKDDPDFNHGQRIQSLLEGARQMLLKRMLAKEAADEN